jgi:hypothetical protein
LINGTKVKTNQQYFDKLGRNVFGIVENNIDTSNPTVTVIRVMHQIGNIIPEHHEQLVVMLKDDLEIVASEFH